VNGPARTAAAAMLVVVLVACGTAPDPQSPASPTSPSPTPATSPSGAATPTAGVAAVVLDPSLLAILPADVDGLPIMENAAGERAALGDPFLGEVASSMAAGFAFDPATDAFIYAVVVRLRPGALDGSSFRHWRDSYDEGACSQADGVAGHAETELGGRTVYIGTCAGGLRTYHVWLEDRGVLISASAVGERRLGELLVENLRP